MSKLSHINEEGKAKMVDVGDKIPMKREAKAQGFIKLQKSTIDLIKDNLIKKGDVLTIAEIAGIQGGKRTSDLIPLCHPLPISKISVKTKLMENGVLVESFARVNGQTGIEMEALTAVNISLLTIYDMCKAVDKSMEITGIKLISKTKSELK
jgi:cyclic pyranopterin phosphate synthase